MDAKAWVFFPSGIVPRLGVMDVHQRGMSPPLSPELFPSSALVAQGSCHAQWGCHIGMLLSGPQLAHHLHPPLASSQPPSFPLCPPHPSWLQQRPSKVAPGTSLAKQHPPQPRFSAMLQAPGKTSETS